MSFGLIIIGDEILSGKREDKHLAQVIGLLNARGLSLSWAHYLPDERSVIADFLERTMNSNDIVFCTGGIGATPDDHTRQAAAEAAEVPVVRHPEAAKLIIQRIHDMAMQAGRTDAPDMALPENDQRLQMADFPLGADLIPNAYNRIPGFSIGQHYFVPGFPVMAWPMIEWVLDTKYAHLFHRQAKAERSILVFDRFEAQLTPLMVAIEAQHPGIKVFSLPSVGDDKLPKHIELGVKGEAARVEAAYLALLEGLRAAGARLGDELAR